MEKLRIGDLLPLHPDAAELIDSAQDAAKKLARCCSAKDAEIAELNATVERYQHQVLDQLAEIARLREENEFLRKQRMAFGMRYRDKIANLESTIKGLREAIREAVESRHAESGQRDTVLRWLASWRALEKIAREGR